MYSVPEAEVEDGHVLTSDWVKCNEVYGDWEKETYAYSIS